MAKKTFKDNPALQFISSSGDDTHDKQNTDNTQDADYTDNKHNTDTVHSTDNKKERETKRLNLLLQPSVLNNLSKIAHMKQTSVNDLINCVLKDYAEKEKHSVTAYNKIFKKKV